MAGKSIANRQHLTHKQEEAGMNQELRKIQNKETYPVKTCDVPYPIVCQYGEKERIGDLF
jgi:hypothetical protein